MVAVKVCVPLAALVASHAHILIFIPEQVSTRAADLELNSVSPRSASLNVLDLSKICFQHQEKDLPTISKNILLGFLK